MESGEETVDFPILNLTRGKN